MSEDKYSISLLDHMFMDIQETLRRIEAQTTKTNGRVTKLEKYLMVIAVAGGTALLIYFPQLIEAIKLFI